MRRQGAVLHVHDASTATTMRELNLVDINMNMNVGHSKLCLEKRILMLAPSEPTRSIFGVSLDVRTGETETVLDMHPVHSRVTAMHVSGTSVSVGTDCGEVLAWHLGQRHDASRMGQGRRSVIPDAKLIAEARALGVARRKPTVTLPPAQHTRLQKPMSMPMIMPVPATAAQNNLHTRLAALQMRLQALEGLEPTTTSLKGLRSTD